MCACMSCMGSGFCGSMGPWILQGHYTVTTAAMLNTQSFLTISSPRGYNLLQKPAIGIRILFAPPGKVDATTMSTNHAWMAAKYQDPFQFHQGGSNERTLRETLHVPPMCQSWKPVRKITYLSPRWPLQSTLRPYFAKTIITLGVGLHMFLLPYGGSWNFRLIYWRKFKGQHDEGEQDWERLRGREGFWEDL